MSIIIQPNAVIALAATYPSTPDQAAVVQLPLDPSVQGMPPLSTEVMQAALWIYMRNILELRARVDRLERILATLDEGPDLLERMSLQGALDAEVRARRAAEAKARAEREAAGGVQ